MAGGIQPKQLASVGATAGQALIYDTVALTWGPGVPLDLQLVADVPMFPTGTTYSITKVGARVTQEKWTRTVGATNLRTIDYTYVGNRVSAEVRKVYAADGSTVLAQITLTYSYTFSTVTGITTTRDV